MQLDVDVMDAAACRAAWSPEPGDVWKLTDRAGVEHLMVCGDCRAPEVRALVGEVDVLATDPPYGIAYASNRVPVPAGGDRTWRAEVQTGGTADIRVRDCSLSVIAGMV